MKEERILFLSKYCDVSHQMIMTFYPEYDEKGIFVEILLNPESSFFKRVRNAFRYLFMKDIREYGNFTEIILTDEDLPGLEKIVKYLKE